MKAMDQYCELFERFGAQGWWPVHKGKRRPGFDPVFEIMVGTILTQNTSWKNVEKAIENLHCEQVLDVPSMIQVHHAKLKSLIKPAGYYNQKAKKLKILAKHISDHYNSDSKQVAESASRGELLNIWGIGPETADSILLYAGNRPEFVIDTYTRRLCKTHGIEFKTYDEYKHHFESQLKPDYKLFNQYHALIVAWGKNQ